MGSTGICRSDSPITPLTPQQWADYESFVAANKSAFRRIAYRTAGEHDHHDVQHEALEMALRIRDKHGIAINFTDPEFQSMLFRYLHQHLVAYADTKVRYGVRLDHGVGEDEDMPHPLANMLASDDGRDPLALLIAKEAALGTDANAENHPSLAAAYARLLSHFNNHVVSVASHLLLSLSYTNKRISHARTLAVHQQPLTLSPPSATFLPGPWRRFKLKRQHEQFAFDFGEAQTLAMDH